MTGNPYISFVVVSRNDDHGGDLRIRTQAFLDSLAGLCRRHRVLAELVMVEWNPPADRPPLRESLRWPDSGGFCTYRVITVPHRLHARMENSDRLPLFQMIGKNVGIRRARGTFVLATNVDLVFSAALGEVLEHQRLAPRRYYRVDRLDVPHTTAHIRDYDARLEFCQKHVFRVNTRLGSFTPEEWVTLRSNPMRRFGRKVHRSLSASWRSFCARFLGGTTLEEILPIFHPRRVVRACFSGAAARWCGRLGWAVLRRSWHTIQGIPRLFWSWNRPHTNACGDFTLLHREDWHRLRGYAQWPIFSWHLDSLLIYQARAAGLREVVLPTPVYHIEHAAGWTPEQADPLWTRLREKQIPFLTNDDLHQYHQQLRRRRIPWQINGDDWGLGRDELPETTIAPDAQEAQLLAA